jgi:hypothetical protein
MGWRGFGCVDVGHDYIGIGYDFIWFGMCYCIEIIVSLHLCTLKNYIHNILINQWKTTDAKSINANTKTTKFCPPVAQNAVDAVKKE